jgi:hypothetical protein
VRYVIAREPKRTVSRLARVAADQSDDPREKALSHVFWSGQPALSINTGGAQETDEADHAEHDKSDENG